MPSSHPEKPITRKDIAELLGVSVSVVSRALNNSGYVEEKKRQKIIRTAEELGYVPQPVAMSLQERRTKQILFYCKDLNNEFNLEMYRGMCKTANERGYMVVMNGVLSFARIRDTMIDGIIMPNENLTEYYLEQVGKNYYLPVVSASYCNPVNLPKSVPLVEIDMYRAMEVGMQYLFHMGHKRIAFGFPYSTTNPNSRLLAFKEQISLKSDRRWQDWVVSVHWLDKRDDIRLMAFKEDMEDNSLKMEEDFFAKGEIAAQLFQERKMDATAVICFNDEFALGMMRELQRMGVKVPQDISIVGIDGTRARRYVTPLLTTVDANPQRQGGECAKILIDLIEKKNTTYIVHQSVRLLEGESVKELRSRR